MELEVRAFNLIFKGLSKDYLLSLLERKDALRIVTPVNAELIVMANKEERFRNLLCNNIATIDGQIPYFILKFRRKARRIEKISGSDLIYDICKRSAQLNLKVFLLGGLKQSNKISQRKLKTMFPTLSIRGYSPPYSPYPFPKELNRKILEILQEFSPDVLFVAFGAPKQEYWIEDNRTFLERLGIRLVIAVGGTFELVAGIEKRAPKFIQQIGLESVWRLYQNPKRFKRFLRNFKFFKYAFK